MMTRKRLRITSLVLLLGVLAAIPASAQSSSGMLETAQENHLPMLILVNKMELTVEQMEQIHGILNDLLEEQEANELRREELEQDMIAFNKPAEELDEILEIYRAETMERVELAREQAAEAVDQIKEILTFKQGEILAELLPGFLVDREAASPMAFGWRAIHGSRNTGERLTGVSELRQRFAERLEQQPGDRSETLGQLRQTFEERTLRARTSGEPGDRMGGSMQMKHGMTNRRPLGLIEQIVEVLELKLEALK